MMRSPIKTFFEKRKREALLLFELEKKEKELAKKEVSIATKEMISKRCPISAAMCKDDCVHFRSGCVSSFVDLDGRHMYWSNSPRCKLWGGS